MITAAPIIAPEPATPACRKAPEFGDQTSPGPRFDEILDRRDPAEPAREPIDPTSEAKVAETQTPTNDADAKSSNPPAAEAPDESKPEDESASDDKSETPDAATLSSQLAMWQILPPPVDPMVKIQEKLAAPTNSSVEGAVAADEVPIDGAAPQSPAAKISANSAPQSPAASSSPATRAPAATDPAELEQKLPEVPGEKLPLPATSTPAPVSPTLEESLAGKVSPTVGDAAQKVRISTSGIPVAKQQRAMSDRELQSPLTPATAGFAGAGVAAKSAAQIAPVAPAAGKNFQEQPREQLDGKPDAPANSAAFSIADQKPQHASSSTEFSAPVQATDTAKVIEQIEHAVERLRTQGGQKIEMRLPLQEGGEVVVKLQMEAGQVKAIFRTESGGLRDALQAGWNQFSATSPERAAKVTTVVFESPAQQSGMGSFGDAPDQRGRQQAFADAESNPASTAIPPPKARISNSPIRPPQMVGSATGLQIYA